MRYYNLAIFVLLSLAITFTSSTAKDGDSDGEDGGSEDANESTSTVSSGYNSNRSTDGINANLGYTNNLTKNLLFEFDVGLTNSFNTSEKREIQNHSIALSNKYDPPSPWKLEVSYNYSRGYNHRPSDVNQDEYFAYNRNHSLTSSVSYTFTEKVRTYLDVRLSKEVKESIVAGQSNPDTNSENKSIVTSIEYDITPNTSMTFGYTGGIDSTEYSGSRERVADPIPPPKKGRTENNTIRGVISSTNSLTENIGVDISFTVNDAIKRDVLLPGKNSDSLRGTAGTTVTFDPSSKFMFTNSTDLNRYYATYHNKSDYRKEFSKNIYDTDDTTLRNSTALTIKPSGGTSATFTYDITYSSRYRYKDNKVMPTYIEDPDAVNGIYEDDERKFVSGVNTAIGDDLTFHLTYYHSTSHPDFIQNPRKNKSTGIDNLDSNLGYDITEKLRADVKTILNFKSVIYDDVDSAIDDTRESSISLGNDFIYKPSLITKLTLGFVVKKNSSDYLNDPEKDYENVNRVLTTSINQEIGKLLDLTLGVSYKYNFTNFLAKSYSNIRQNIIEIKPSAVFNISESLSSSIGLNFDRVTYWNPIGEDESDVVNSWRQTHNYTTNFAITYNPLDMFTVNFGLGTGHNYSLENKILKVKKKQDNDYYNVSLNINYDW